MGIKIIDFKATKTHCKPREKVVLSWIVKNANCISIKGNNQEEIDVTNKNDLVVAPTDTAQYELTAYEKEDKSDIKPISQNIKIVVIKPVKIKSFKANKEKIVETQKVILSWKVENAKNISLLPLHKNVTQLEQTELFPQQTTTYILKVSNEVSAEEKEVAVCVLPFPFENKISLPQMPTIDISLPDLNLDTSFTSCKLTDIENNKQFLSQLKEIYTQLNNSLKDVLKVPSKIDLSFDKLNNYENNINNNKSNRMKLIKKLFKPKVIQIGVGGYSSCGKTVLIDAMFAALDKDGFPKYLPNTFVNSKYLSVADDIFDGKYKDYGGIRKNVTTYFHSDNKTTDDGKWNCNMFWAKLKANKGCILLIRNLPGEMFNEYFNGEYFGGKESIDSIFNTFISQNKEYKTKYKHFFDYSAFRDETENKIKSFKDVFVEYIKNNYDEIFKHDNFKFVMNDFFAYLFYKSSDTVIRCIKSANRSDDEDKVNIDMMNYGGTKSNDYFCMTQIDRIMLKKGEVNLLKENFEQYAETMSKIYDDIDNETFEQIEKDKWNHKGVDIDNRLPYFTSVAFNIEQNNFLNFEGEKNAIDKWERTINYQRTSLGVIELALNILKRHNVKLKGLPRLDNTKYGSFLERKG